VLRVTSGEGRDLHFTLVAVMICLEGPSGESVCSLQRPWQQAVTVWVFSLGWLCPQV
jgi:hypothetical protein